MKIKDIVNQEKFRKKIKLDIFKKILKDNLNITNEQVLIIGDKGYKDNLISPILTNAYSLAAEEMGLKYKTLYQNFKVRKDEADEVVISSLKKLPRKSVLIINISNRTGSLGTLGLSLRNYMKERQHRFVSSSSLGSISNMYLPLIIDCLDVDYKELHKKTERLKKILTNGREIHMSTKIGTDLSINIEGMEGKGASGIYREPGTGGNLPGSEAYIAPNGRKVDGRIIIDGSARLKDRTLLVQDPIVMDVTKGVSRISNNTKEAKLLRETLLWAQFNSAKPENVWRIAELGIGLNKKAKVIGATIIDEKTYNTAHVAVGSNAWFGGDIKSIIHLDHVLHNPVFKVDSRLLKY